MGPQPEGTKFIASQGQTKDFWMIIPLKSSWLKALVVTWSAS